MKAILKFNLDEQDDKMAHMRALKATNMALALWDMQQYFRGKLKHGELSNDADSALSNARDILREIMSDHSIDLDELIN